jgi:cyclophilin family peptidyl-prolyl cis-trans isomerase
MTTPEADDPGCLLQPIGAHTMADRQRDQRLRRNRPAPEVLEDRRLLASLAAIANLTVPAQQGYTLPLDGSGTTADQTFTITRISGSPDITASIPQGPFWTINVNYSDPSDSNDDFNGSLVFQLFQNLTPNTVSEIEEFTNDGYYTGKEFTRIVGGFPGSANDVVQGGAPDPYGVESSGQPGTPFLNENVQQLAFTGTYQLAMANAGVDTSLPNASQGVNTNDTQFFVTTNGSPDSELGYGYTIFGQLVAGQATLTKMTQVPVTTNPYTGEDSLPVNPVVMSSLSLSTENPNGVALIDTTQAKPGETATFQVTATDSTGGTTTRTFTVTVGPYAGPTDPAIDFQPFADSASASLAEGSSTTITLQGQAGYPDTSQPGTLTYSLVSQPSHGTISDFNASTGTFVYTPQPGYSGSDSIQYKVSDDGPAPPIGVDQSTGQTLYGPATTTTSDVETVTINVTPTPTSPTPTSPSPTPTSPSPTPTPSPAPIPPPPVTLTGVVDVTNKKHQVTEVYLTFSGPIDPAGATNTATYHLIERGKKGQFVATKATTIAIKSASYNGSDDTVELIPRKPFALSKPVEVVVDGEPPSGLHDTLGRLIDGTRDGQPGGNATAILSKHSVTMAVSSPTAAIATTDAVDVLLAQSASDGLVHTRATAWLRDDSTRRK